ncbi:MAG: hypothetical protein ACOY0T_03170 [Myxococcota bacterium]
MRSFSTLVALIMGCTQQPRLNVALAPVRTPAPLSAPAPNAPFEPSAYRAINRAEAAILPPEINSSGRIACRFESSDLSAPVRLAATDEPFAQVTTGYPGSLLLPEGDAAQGALASFELPGLHLNAVVSAKDVPFALKRATLLGGYLWTSDAHALVWKSARAGHAHIEIDPGPRIQPVKALPVVEAACENLTLDWVGADLYTATALAPKRLAWETRWIGEARVPLSLHPSNDLVAYLDTREEEDDEETDAVYVLETRGASQRIIYPLEHALVVGWVPASSLQPEREPFDWSAWIQQPTADWGPTDLSDADDPTRNRHAASSTQEFVCAWNAPLVVQTPASSRQVGTLASSIPILVGSSRNGLRRVTLAHPTLSSFDTHASFWVPEDSLYPCAPGP